MRLTQICFDSSSGRDGLRREELFVITRGGGIAKCRGLTYKVPKQHSEESAERVSEPEIREVIIHESPD